MKKIRLILSGTALIGIGFFLRDGFDLIWERRYEIEPTSRKIAKGYGRMSVRIPTGWEMVRNDYGWEESDSTFYLVSPSGNERYLEDHAFPEYEQDWPPYILFSFHRKITEPKPKDTRFNPLLTDPAGGKTDSGITYAKWKTKGPNVPVTNGTPDLNGRFIQYHFLGMPYQVTATVKYNRWQEMDVSSLLQGIVESVDVIPSDGQSGGVEFQPD